ncbi:leucine-rich repeat-containing protein 17 [Brienomyrus brachyistius]|uniref:leucine-rich repeat-containing protein 17 n=1 Tax=Brienomyrus brachyistius TaxID=42636 RepID=UPI0020B435B1|nr:leucine-rich repeat-containing protein 17 [Brienomyrus brachyistius]
MRVTVVLLVFLLWGSPVVGEARRGAGRTRARSRVRQGTAKRFAEECVEYTEAGERYLDCQERRLSAVPAGQHSDVHHLLLARNQIHVLPDDAFAHFPNLRSLDLQQNGLSRVSRRTFAGLARLTTLLLQHNGLRSLDEETLLPLTRLAYLRLYDNPWDCRCQLDSLVRTLQVPGNRNLGNYAECAEPHTLRGHRLKRVKPERLCSSLEDNALQQPEGPDTKTTGSVQHPYTSTACKTDMSLLDCRDGELMNVPVDLPPYYVNIDLSKNNIKHLRAKMFLGSKDLKSLNLSNNGLELVDTAAFAGLLYLRELDLSNNSLHYIQYGVLEDLYFIRRLGLGGNPWVCDYNIHYLLYWLKLHPGVQHSGLICHSPAEFAGWSVQEYVRTYNEDCPKDRVPGQNMAPDPGTQNTSNQEPNALEVMGKIGQYSKDQLPRPLRASKRYVPVRVKTKRQN